VALPARGAPPQYGNEGGKAGLVTVARVSEECRSPGQPIVRRQVKVEPAEPSL